MISSVASWLGQSALAASLLAILGYLSRNFLEARLTRGVQHGFDKKLAKFKDELEEQAGRRESVRNAAFSALLAQRSALAAKRIRSAQTLWDGILDARKGTFIALQMDLLKLDAIVAELHDPRMKQYLQLAGSGEAMEDQFISRLHEYASVRPFVSPTAWALFSVYSSIIAAALGKMKMLQVGYDPRRFFKDVHWAALLPGVLPPDDIQKIGQDSDHGVQWVLSRIEERVVEELQRSLAEASAGLESVAHAQRILSAAEGIEAARVEEAIRKQAPPGALKP